MSRTNNVSSLFFKVESTESSPSGKACFKRKKFLNNANENIEEVEDNQHKNAIGHKCEQTNMQIITLNGNNSTQIQMVKLIIIIIKEN
jgi:hypothetical protein